jgi:glycosyltransferase involved in cell wall biosynthesis
MKIILATGWMCGYTGSETWTYTMAKYLSRKHDVKILTQNPGLLSDKVDFCPVITKYEPCDLAIVNHKPMRAMIPVGVPVIYTSHSVFHDVEKYPDDTVIKAAPSFEIADIYADKYDVTVIYQPVDMERFKPSPINDKPKDILYLCNPNYARGADFVKEAFKGYNVLTIDKPVFNIEDYIKQADVVVSLGRGIYEALAMGRNVISGDWRCYMKGFEGAGMITDDNFSRLLLHNLSGRADPVKFTPDTLRAELDKYDPDRIIDMTPFNAETIADNYLTLWRTNTSAVI